MDEAALRKAYEAAGQEQVFRFAGRLSAAEKQAFLVQLEGVDLGWVKARFEQFRREQAAGASTPRLAPAPVITLPRTEGEKQREREAREAGEEMLSAGRVAAFLVAGGQGTRLGFDGPKGCFPLGPVTGRSLFQWHAEQIRARAKRYGKRIPWYIMTSEVNDAATRRYFEEKGFFGLGRNDVMFFAQAMAPALDFEGQLLLEAPGRLALSPNGHGGSLAALVDSGATARMRERGIETISYFQVDNPLVTVADPVFLGYHGRAGAQMSSKVLEKAYPEEKLGAIGLVNGKLGVIEYSDLDREQMYAKGSDGRLLFWAGSIAIHMLERSFVESVGRTGGLPWHCAVKKIPHLGADGKPVAPREPNGVKFETFVFDALPLARASVTMEVAREREFAPVKNAEGVDSPATARQLLSEEAARILAAAGVDAPRGAEGRVRIPIELPYTRALEAGDFAESAGPSERSDAGWLFEAAEGT